ncbi:hypothetical protein D3C86_887910 [compost metagenome]
MNGLHQLAARAADLLGALADHVRGGADPRDHVAQVGAHPSEGLAQGVGGALGGDGAAQIARGDRLGRLGHGLLVGDQGLEGVAQVRHLALGGLGQEPLDPGVAPGHVLGCLAEQGQGLGDLVGEHQEQHDQDDQRDAQGEVAEGLELGERGEDLVLGHDHREGPARQRDPLDEGERALAVLQLEAHHVAGLGLGERGVAPAVGGLERLAGAVLAHQLRLVGEGDEVARFREEEGKALGLVARVLGGEVELGDALAERVELEVGAGHPDEAPVPFDGQRHADHGHVGRAGVEVGLGDAQLARLLGQGVPALLGVVEVVVERGAVGEARAGVGRVGARVPVAPVVVEEVEVVELIGRGVRQGLLDVAIELIEREIGERGDQLADLEGDLAEAHQLALDPGGGGLRLGAGGGFGLGLDHGGGLQVVHRRDGQQQGEGGSADAPHQLAPQAVAGHQLVGGLFHGDAFLSLSGGRRP